MSDGREHLVRFDRYRAVVTGTRPAATFRIVSSRSAAQETPPGVCRGGKVDRTAIKETQKHTKLTLNMCNE